MTLKNGLRTLAVFLLIFFAAAGFAAAGETAPAPEAPPAVRFAREEITEDVYPAVIDRTRDPLAYDAFRFRLDAKLLDIWFPNIANADEAILIYDGNVWLIDCGDQKAGERGAELIRRLGISRIGRLFNSHPHHDHILGLQETDAAARVEELLVCFGEDSTDSMVKALKYAFQAGIPVSRFADGDTFAMGDGQVTLHFLQNTEPTLDMNNQSAQTMVAFGKRKILFTGDMEADGQAALVARVGDTLQADILKYPHHGKKALDAAFRQAVSPLFAVVTNQQVDWEGVAHLTAVGIPFAFTNRGEQYLHLATDGEHWICEYVQKESLRGLLINTHTGVSKGCLRGLCFKQ